MERISVKKELPKTSELVIVTVQYNAFRYVTRCCYSYDSWFYLNGSPVDSDEDNVSVIAWIPNPEPYEE